MHVEHLRTLAVEFTFLRSRVEIQLGGFYLAFLVIYVEFEAIWKAIWWISWKRVVCLEGLARSFVKSDLTFFLAVCLFDRCEVVVCQS